MDDALYFPAISAQRAAEVLLRIALDEDQPTADRIAAAKVLLDRAWEHERNERMAKQFEQARRAAFQ